MNIAHESVELWGGVECTVNRVGDRYFDQMEASGHATRISDLDAFAALGFRTLRQAVLWERTARDDGSEDFSWSDERLRRLRALEIRPIVGLLHHGSGPRHTSLLDPEFPALFAAYARRVAQRYPWVTDWTPINEPLTTARFSGLYGHWYPHERSEHSFCRALVHQCKAIVLAMKEISAENPEARLVQTEDMGFTRSTERLSYQAAFENDRRFLSLDLLAGRVTPGHPLRQYLVDAGILPEELDWFTEHARVPDLFGLNYYVTSERFLDHRVARYPAHLVGGNGEDAYADVEAVRACPEGMIGPKRMLQTLFARYGAPVAITEAHLGADAEDRGRWLSYVVREAIAARRESVDVRAVCVWALLGSHGWRRLVTHGFDPYEAGVFDLRDGVPCKTAVVDVVRALCHGDEPRAAWLASDGWWTRPERIIYPSYPEERAA